MGRQGERAITAALLAAVVVILPRGALATPQLGAAATTGVALTDLRDNGPRVAYHLGARLDALFLRDAPRQMALGPYLDVATAAFDTFETGGGVEWLIPLDATAFVLSAGTFARTSSLGWQPGAAGGLFWGSRSFNYHSAYAMSVGLFAQGRYGLGDSRQADVIGGVQIDLEYFVLPFLLAYEAITR
jgi:hypothetical protein